jgi:phospholipase C
MPVRPVERPWRACFEPLANGKGVDLLTGKKSIAAVLAAGALGASAIGISVSAASSGSDNSGDPAAAYATTTPIKHLVVIYGENVSFDHYFATYPNALNPAGEPQFHALPDTPTVNGLNTTLLDANPNEYNPARLDPTQAVTCDQNHGYTAEQSAYDGGLMDQFVQDTTGGGCTQGDAPDNGSYGPKGIVMDYYDGNTVTALWNYAQHFTLNDNSFSTQFGPSTPGAINVISGQTNGAVAENGTSGAVANGTDESDVDPFYDECSNPSAALSSTDIPGTGIASPGGVTMAMTGKNIGDELNAKNITWGWFEGGFTPSSYANGRPVCGSTHTNVGGANMADYIPHHEPFQYYQSTANPMHNSPASIADVGVSDPAGTPLANAVNHQYDASWFNQTLTHGNMPAVSYLKAPGYEDGHAGYSDPLDEQRFLVDEINAIEQSKFWPSTAIVLAYDDSDGWYDHQMGPIVRASQDALDTLNGPGKCGSASQVVMGQQDRCGVGPRQPLLVISPWAKQNYVDNTFTEQASIVRFIEDNWGLDRIGGGAADAAAETLMNAFDFNQSYGHAPAVILNDTTGEVEQTIYPNGHVDEETQPPTVPVQDQPGQTSAQSGQTSAPAATPAVQPAASLRKLPELRCTKRLQAARLQLTCMTSGTDVGALLRARLYRGHRLIANVARRVTHSSVRFSLSLDHSRHARIARYRVTISIDSGGQVRGLIRTFRAR